jgi:hypothetical protein
MPWSNVTSTLTAEVVNNGQALDTTCGGQCVHHEIKTPHLVDLPSFCERHAFILDTLDFATFAHRQVVLSVQPPNALMFDCMTFAGEQIVDAPLAEATTFVRKFNDSRAQRRGLRADGGRCAIAGSGYPHKATDSALGDIELLDHLAHRLTPHL